MSPFIEQRISKYGKIFRSQLPGRRVIFSGDAELNRIVLQNTGQVINETLRLGHVVRYLPRKVTKTIQFKGFDIPNGYTVIPALAAVHMDPSLFDDPQCFNPWRWQKESSSPARTNNIMSFGGGLRLCPGMELAKVELSVFIHRLVLAYVWETEEPDPPMALPMVDFARGMHWTLDCNGTFKLVNL
ncbi:Cytochrome P450 90B1 [Acorus calamus]|uniref:Cytochrome P450 90B1 n=1 Tax=Acorus calamus TaxID=4465 RepID=A0AAV9CJN4_ACOCL|nr:Cytochrome P450 90B1 [Acorus calamus]